MYVFILFNIFYHGKHWEPLVSKEIKTVLPFLEFNVKCIVYESLPDLFLCLKLFQAMYRWRYFQIYNKKHFQSTMSQDRLINLSILFIWVVYAKIKFDKVINESAQVKNQKQTILLFIITVTDQCVRRYFFPFFKNCINVLKIINFLFFPLGITVLFKFFTGMIMYMKLKKTLSAFLLIIIH